jgi:hypothetical protein
MMVDWITSNPTITLASGLTFGMVVIAAVVAWHDRHRR